MASRHVNTRTFGASYGVAFLAFLEQGGESQLHAAYELGRDAVTAELSILDLAVAHHHALGDALGSTDDSPAVAAAAGEFFLEALSAYEMVQRGFRDAQEAAAIERRQAELLRQLSNFLADASVALASDSLEEVLQLVAEQARELTGAHTCRVTLDIEGRKPVEAVAAPENDRWSRLLDTHMSTGPEQVERETHGERRMLREPLTTLDGRPIGTIEVMADDFTELEAAVLIQLAQMASAAVERRSLYRAR